MEIVLVDPQIPQNTGSIARSCAALKIPLHIVGNPPFELSDKRAKRAGLDYWPYVILHQHENWYAYKKVSTASSFWFFSTHGKRPFYEASYTKDAALVFGSETKGLGKDFLAKCDPESILVFPMLEKNVRSLNLSNVVTAAMYECYRQTTI